MPRNTVEHQETNEWFLSEVKPHEGVLRSFIYKKLPDKSEVDDVVQEALFRLVKEKQNKPIQSHKGFMFAIAKNILSDVYRKKYKAQKIFLRNLEDIPDISDSNHGADQVRASDQIEILREAIETLPNKCKMICKMRYFQHMSYRQIADQLGISPNTVEAQLAIALTKCRKFFKSKGLH